MNLTDQALRAAIVEMETGLYDANLGGHVYKKRIGSGSKGKRGGYRTLLTYKKGILAVFVVGFQKNERDNIDRDELQALKELTKQYLSYTPLDWDQVIAAGGLLEVTDDA